MAPVSGVCAKGNMLTHKEALQKILSQAQPLAPKRVLLRESLGLVLSEDIVAPEPFPSFNNSAVDGYAVSGISQKVNQKQIKFKVTGEIRAGECFKGSLKSGHAVRIFTGAPVPNRTQAVAMQEYVERANGHVSLLKELAPHENIRFCGEDVRIGKTLLKKNSAITPSHLALLAALGCHKILVTPVPKVSILATGSELIKIGEPLRPGKIRDSNTILLEALVKQAGGIPLCLPNVGDSPAKIRFLIREGLKQDVLLISGGVSVGKYDFVKEILREEGVKEIFWKVDIKPGKPLFFGKKNRTLVFGLPGNPVSVFVTFEEFAKPALLKLMGKKNFDGQMVQGSLAKPFMNGPRFHFVRVQCVQKRGGFAITPLKGQGSHMVGSLASANALLRVKANASLKKNTMVSVKLLDGGKW